MTVFVVQNLQRRNRATGQWEPVHDLSPALVHGEVSFLLGPTATPYGDPSSIVAELHDKLEQYDPDKDHILPIGNPALIGWAIAIAADHGQGRVRTLVWSSQEQLYKPTEAVLFQDC